MPTRDPFRLRQVTTSTRQLTIRATERFVRDFDAASATLREGARREVRELSRRALLDPRWLHLYDKVEGLGRALPGRFIELEIAAGPRLVAYVDGLDVVLVALGDHEIVPRLKRQRRVRAELDRLTHPPAGFVAASFSDLLASAVAADGRSGADAPLGPEVQPEWLHFLSEEQEQTWLGIATAIEESLEEPGAATVHFIEGGPGTGKTSVLLNLIDHFEETGVTIDLRMSPHLVDFIEAQTSRSLHELLNDDESAEVAQVTLVDDPASLQELWHFALLAERRLETWESTAVVVAFDPLQVEGTRSAELSDESLARIRDRSGAVRWPLRDCYRQKERIGRAALNLTQVILGSSPYLVDHKRKDWAQSRREIAEAALDLRFISPAGSSSVFERATWRDWRGYLERVSRDGFARMREGDPRHWPLLAVVLPIEASLPDAWRSALRDVRHDLLNDGGWVDQLRGVEYAHVAIVLTSREFEMVTAGFSGTGRADYERFRLLRIPFSRARDSLAVFVIDEDA